MPVRSRNAGRKGGKRGNNLPGRLRGGKGGSPDQFGVTKSNGYPSDGGGGGKGATASAKRGRDASLDH